MAKIGTNIIVEQDADYIILKIKKNAPQLPSTSGKSKLLASSGGFKSLGNFNGKLAGKDVGLNLNINIRDKKAGSDDVVEEAEEKPAAKTTAAPKKGLNLRRGRVASEE
jgi:hypothetical protein